MIKRILARRMDELLSRYPVLTLTGPRQSGKTTLSRMVLSDAAYVNLESLQARDFALDDPVAFLAQFKGKRVIIDEIQRVPKLLSQIQVIVDEERAPGRFLLTGSQNFSLMSRVSQSLAGRTALLTLMPLSLKELGPTARKMSLEEVIFKGFYPKLYDRDISPVDELSFYVQTYLERDVREVENVRNLRDFSRFLRLAAGRTGQVLNVSSLAADVGISPKVAGDWISLLEASYVIRLLEPWHANVGKRLVKAPKLYFNDVGLAANLIGITEPGQLFAHPLRGALFETLVVGEFFKDSLNRGTRPEINYYRDSNGNEIDLVIADGGVVSLYEIKSGSTASGDWISTVARLSGMFGPSVRRAVVYGGDEDQSRTVYDVLSWRGL